MLASAIKGHSTPGLKWLATDKLKRSIGAGGSNSSAITKTSDIAFIQYSSGSTSAPKGVIISHPAIIHNLSLMATVLVERWTVNNSTQKTGVYCETLLTWCPQYHDYALVGNFLLCACNPSFNMVAFSPFDFIKNPLLWADALEKYNITITSGPNFAYNLLAKRLKAASRTLSVPLLRYANIA